MFYFPDLIFSAPMTKNEFWKTRRKFFSKFFFCEFDQAIIDINWGYTTVDYEGSGNNFVPSVSHFYEQESEKIGAAMEEYGVIGKKVIEGLLKRE